MTNPEQNEILKECPFCGGKPTFINNLANPEDEFSSRLKSITLKCSGHGCVTMECGIHYPGYDHAKSLLIEKWNNRPSPEPKLSMLDERKIAGLILAYTHFDDQGNEVCNSKQIAKAICSKFGTSPELDRLREANKELAIACDQAITGLKVSLEVYEREDLIKFVEEALSKYNQGNK